MRLPEPFKILGLVIVIVLVAGCVVLIWRDVGSRRGPNQARFNQGTLPEPMPDGAYKGSVNGYSGGWIGKVFDSARGTGRNQFKEPEGIQLLYPFKTWVGRGVADPIQVVRIDYDIPENPIWLRGILDEIVQVGPDHYLGKVHLKWGPVHATVGYFELKK